MVLMKGRGSEEELQKLDKKDHFSRRMSIPTKNLSSQQLLKVEEAVLSAALNIRCTFSDTGL
jgi:hypothetical protein